MGVFRVMYLLEFYLFFAATRCSPTTRMIWKKIRPGKPGKPSVVSSPDVRNGNLSGQKAQKDNHSKDAKGDRLPAVGGEEDKDDEQATPPNKSDSNGGGESELQGDDVPEGVDLGKTGGGKLRSGDTVLGKEEEFQDDLTPEAFKPSAGGRGSPQDGDAGLGGIDGGKGEEEGAQFGDFTLERPRSGEGEGSGPSMGGPEGEEGGFRESFLESEEEDKDSGPDPRTPAGKVYTSLQRLTDAQKRVLNQALSQSKEGRPSWTEGRTGSVADLAKMFGETTSPSSSRRSSQVSIRSLDNLTQMLEGGECGPETVPTWEEFREILEREKENLQKNAAGGNVVQEVGKIYDGKDPVSKLLANVDAFIEHIRTSSS